MKAAAQRAANLRKRHLGRALGASLPAVALGKRALDRPGWSCVGLLEAEEGWRARPTMVHELL